MAIISDDDVQLWTEVRDVLNAAGGSVNNSLPSFYTTSAKLNMWSKYKPVVSSVEHYTLSTWKSSGYKGGDLKCGLSIKTYSTLASFRSALEGGTALWTYVIPNGSNGPMRLGDFRGYYTDAINPVGEIVTNGLQDSNGYVTFSIDVATVDEDNNLTYSDITVSSKVLTSYYLGIYAYNGSTYRYATGTSTIGNNYNFNVKLQLTTGDWTYVPFLCSVPQTGTETSGTYISANMVGKKITVKSASTLRVVMPYGAWNVAGTKVVNIQAYLYNNSSSSYTFSGIVVQLRYGNTGASSNLVASVSYSGSVTVAANSYKVIDLSDITASRVSSRVYWVAGYATNVETTYQGVDEIAPEG